MHSTTTMASITTKKTFLGMTNTGKRLVLLKKQYELIPELWEEVLSYFNEAVEKRFNKLGMHKLHSIFKDVFRMGYTNMYNSNIPLERRRGKLMVAIMKYHHNKSSLAEYIPEKKKKDWSGHEVGTAVRWLKHKYDRDYIYGRIVKVGDKSVTAERHEYTKEWTTSPPTYIVGVPYVIPVVVIGEPTGDTKVFISPMKGYDRKEEGEFFQY